MKNLPHIPRPITATISGWITGETLMLQRKTAKSMEDLKLFYRKLKLSHDVGQLFYRGITTSPNGFVEMMVTGKINLKKKELESWSCDMDIARDFSTNRDFGIIFGKTIPKRKIIADFIKLYDMYEPVKKDYYDGKLYNNNARFDVVSMLDTIERMKECEILTNSICTKCEVEDCVEISFNMRHNIQISNTGYTIVDALETFSKIQDVDKSIKFFIQNYSPSNKRLKLYRKGNRWTLLDR